MKKKRRKSLISLLCVITMLVGLFSGIPFGISEVEAGTGTSYRELTFSDWGYADGNYDSAKYQDPTTTLSDLDGVAFTGNVTFRANEDTNYLLVGSTSAGLGSGIRVGLTASGFQLVYWHSSGATDTFYTASDYGLEYGTAFKLRMTFDKDGDNYIVKTWVNDKLCKKDNVTELTVPASYLGTKLGVSGNGDKNSTIESVVIEREYQELTFSDWGYADGNYDSAKYQDPTTTLSDLDGVAFTGNVTFRANEDTNYLLMGSTSAGLGSGIRVGLTASGFQLVYWHSSGATDNFYTASDYGLEYGTAFKLRMTFDKEGDNYIVKTWVNDKLCENSKGTEITVPASHLGTKLGVSGNGDKNSTIESVVIEREYQELTFSDWGYADGNYDSAKYQDPTTTLSDLDGVAFTGNVTFRANEDTNYLLMGSTSAGLGSGIRVGLTASGFQLVYWHSSGATDNFYTASDYGMEYGTAFKLRMTFDKDGDNYIVKTWVNGKLCENSKGTEITVPASHLGTKLGVSGNGDNNSTIASVVVKKEYQELTFSDWGYADGNYDSAKYQDPTTTLSDLDGVAFTGNVTFRANEDTNYLLMGSTSAALGSGIRVGLTASGFQLVYWHSSGATDNFYTASDYGLTYGTAFKLRMTFDKDGDNYIVKTWVNDKLCENSKGTEITVPASHLGTKLGVSGNGDNNSTIASIELGTEPEPPIAWQEISFRDFGINDGMYNSSTGTKIGTFNQEASSLDGYMFKGDVKFTNQGAYWCHYLRIGTDATAADSNHDVKTGIQVVPLGDGTLQFQYNADESKKLTFSGYEYGTFISIQVGFHYKSDGTVEVTVAAGDAEAQTMVLSSADGLGTNLFMRSDADMAVQSYGEDPEITWQEISFSDFGINDGEYDSTTGTKIGTFTQEADNLHGYMFKGDVKFTDSTSYWCHYLRIGTDATAADSNHDVKTGIQVVPLGDGRLQFQYNADESKKLYFSGYEYGTYITIQVGFNYKSNGTVEVTVAAGDAEAQTMVLSSADGLGTNLFMRSDSKMAVREKLQIVDAKQILEDAGYQRLTIGDFGMYPGTYEVNGDIYKGAYTDQATLDKTYLDMNLTIDNPSNVETCIRYGGATWTGLNIYKDYSDKTTLCIADTAGGTTTRVTPDMVGRTTFDGVNVKIALDRSGTTYTVTIYVNNVLVVNNRTLALDAETIGNYLGIYVAEKNGDITSTNSITITADATEITKTPASYNLEKGTYLITGAMESVKIGDTEVKDDSAYVQDRAIIYPGDYTVQTYAELKSIRATQKITLYILGDVNCDGKFTDADKTALENMLSGTESFTATTAAQKAADLDNDGKVGSRDFGLMKAIFAKVNPEAARKNVIKKYHPAALTYDFLGGDDVMPIGGMHGPINSTMTLEYFLKLKECGINMINNSIDIGGGTNTVQKSLKLAQDAGIGYFVSDYRLNETETRSATQLAAYMGDYGYYDSFLGINVQDEPFYSASTSINNDPIKHLDNFTDIAAALNKYTNINGFINILPEDSDGVGIGIAGSLTKSYYNEYWEQYKTANPQVYSVDDYPFADSASDTVKSGAIKRYFGSLGKIRKESIANDVPFWYYVQAGGDFEANTNVNNARIATEAETYWNVNTALAFGAKGIEYFPLVQPEEMGRASGDRNGLLNKEGTETTFYTWAQNINGHIAAIDEVLMKSTSTDIVASGGYAKDNAVGKLSCISGDVTDVKTASGKLSGVTSSDTTYGALVGCFDYRDTEAFYVVNYDADSAASATQTVTLTFDDDYNVRVIQQGQTESYQTTSDKKLVLTIPSGQAALVVLQSESKLLCNTAGGITVSGLYADADSTVTITGTTVGGAAVHDTLTSINIFNKWGTYKVQYLIGGQTYSRKLTMYLSGDANFDGVNDSRDLVRMKKAAQDPSTLNEDQKISGDMDGNDTINDVDTLKLRYVLIGKEN